MRKAARNTKAVPLKGPLVVTKDQIRNAFDQKSAGFLQMDPMDFLKLTTASDRDRVWLTYQSPRVLPVKAYNDLALASEILVAPTLWVDMETGKVTGHEGRHRAASIIREYPKEDMWVSIILRGPDGRAVRGMTAKDIPAYFYGQFRETMVRVTADKRHFKPFHE